MTRVVTHGWMEKNRSGVGDKSKECYCSDLSKDVAHSGQVKKRTSKEVRKKLGGIKKDSKNPVDRPTTQGLELRSIKVKTNSGVP